MWGSFTGTAAPNTSGSFPISPNGIIRRAINGAAILRNTIEIEGIQKFAEPQKALLRLIAGKRAALAGSR